MSTTFTLRGSKCYLTRGLSLSSASANENYSTAAAQYASKLSAFSGWDFSMACPGTSSIIPWGSYGNVLYESGGGFSTAEIVTNVAAFLTDGYPTTALGPANGFTSSIALSLAQFFVWGGGGPLGEGAEVIWQIYIQQVLMFCPVAYSIAQYDWQVWPSQAPPSPWVKATCTDYTNVFAEGGQIINIPLPGDAGTIPTGVESAYDANDYYLTGNFNVLNLGSC